MKKLIYILPVVMFLSSCKKLLDVQPQLQVDESQAITSASNAETAVNGLYNTLGNDNYYGSNYPVLSYLSGGDVQWTGSQAAPQQIFLHKLTADNSYVGSAWSAIYKAILQANNIIEKVPAVVDPQFTAAKKNQYLGEALFVRALSYFDLARGWGGVPLILTPTHNAEENINVERSSLDQTYAQVLKDLVAAEGLLPETVNRNKVTKKTVWGLRARYHLYRQEWPQAEDYAGRLINDAANYRLLKPYSAFFANNAVATSESVFEIAYSNSFKNGHANWWLPPASGGRREWAPTDQLVKMLNDPGIGGGRNALIAQTAPPGNLWYGRLYYRNPLGTDPAYILRVAELYFIRSEARAQQGKISEALTDLNAVRDRAGLPSLSADSKERILLSIENERRVEFAFETDRWFNLVRTGRVGAVLGITDPARYLFPIPVSDIVANPLITQNPGY